MNENMPQINPNLEERLLDHDRVNGTVRPINNNKNSDETIPEGATCRICRGESTVDNPLLHPCMCRGSIKYLHEPCLLEWISARHIDINKPGASVECDICHYPFHFKIAYDDSMPDKIPFRLLLLNILRKTHDTIKQGSLLAIIFTLTCIGFPLSWNFYGKIYTFVLDGSLPYPGDLTKSMIFGFAKGIPDDYGTSDIIFQMASNIFFSVCQIAFTVIIHLALYFQYDMIVREDIFRKMIFHKIGPNNSFAAIKERLKQKFPMMDDNTLDHLARIVAVKEVRDEAVMNDEEEDNFENEQGGDDIAINGELDDNEFHEEEDHSDEDFIPSETEEFSDDNTDDSLNTTGDEPDLLREEVEQGAHGDDFHLENPIDDLVNLQAQRQFDDMLDQHRNAMAHVNNQPDIQRPQGDFGFGAFGNNRPQQDMFPINVNNEVLPAEEPMLNPFMGAEDVDEQAANQQAQQIGPFAINFQTTFSAVAFYFTLGVAVIGLYLLIAYLVPTSVGYVLGRLYFLVGDVLIHSIAYLYYVTKVNGACDWILVNIPGTQQILAGISKVNILKYQVIDNFNDFNQKSNTFMRALPASITYLTAIILVCLASEIICKGYGRKNGMENSKRRFAAQILYGLKCTFKVFTLFFIELAGFPILAGVMLDFSLFAPVLGKITDILWIPSTKLVWFQDEIVYWMIGTLYMFWFAKYIGMIREHIIRPGVLYFIRSPEDPNTRILHDSLIHPMGTQISRLCLSMFIYAVFIVFGFGFHTRILFPFILQSRILSTTDDYLSGYVLNKVTLLIVFYFAKRIIEANPNVRNLVREYWTKIFQVSSRKLRLSSFILGTDYSSERGHVVYRNILYATILSKRAQWSNPELYSSPKTASQATDLFLRNKDIHAYFVPDGLLMRVPSSDIVSRNYLQTMFVPVTKSDKLLKPLDLRGLKERNQKNGGEFFYLDSQNTDFDHYFVCYVPPNFRLRYMSLMILIWFFASFIIISTSIVAQYLFNVVVIVLVMLPAKLLRMTTIYELVKDVTMTGFTRINIHYIFLGATIMSFLVDHYKILHLVGVWGERGARNANVVNNQNNQNAVGANDADDIPNIVPRADIAELLFQNAIFKFVIAPALVCVIGVLDYFTFGYIFNIVIRNSIGYIKFMLWNKPMDFSSVYHDFNSPLYYSVDIWLRLAVLLRLSNMFHGIRNDMGGGVRFALLQQWKNTVKPHILFVQRCYMIFVSVILSSIVFEYIYNRDQYANFGNLVTFIVIGRSTLENFNIPWTIPQHYFFISIISILCFHMAQRLFENIAHWVQLSVQSVRDNMFANGRVLENYGTTGMGQE